LWQFNSATDENINRVGLAMASKGKHIATVDIAWVEGEELSTNIDFEAASGDTPVRSLNSFHVDAL